MVISSSLLHHHPLLTLLSFTLLITPATAIRVSAVIRDPLPTPSSSSSFREAPAFRNNDNCDPSAFINVVMTLDTNYLRGTIAAVLSILQHTSCPENLHFHFLSTPSKRPSENLSVIRSVFPYLPFRTYPFDADLVRARISRSVRQALDQPLNYARIYLADILPLDVRRVIYLDSDTVLVDDIAQLWEVDLEGRVVGAPEYCHANFTKYFTDAFWRDPVLSKKAFHARSKRAPCYFNTGVMVMDVERWRRGGYTARVEEWMVVQKRKRIYHLGSLPPFLLVLAGDIKAVDHRWNQHGLGGDNIEGRCRSLHPGPVSLLHWSGKGKPWLRLDSRRPCAVDHLWAPYDLYRSSVSSLAFEE